MKTAAIIASGGQGKRMGPAGPKQFIEVNGKPILAYALSTFNSCADVNDIILTAPAGYESTTSGIARAYGIDKVSGVITGGGSRQETVYNALRAARGADIILIHDAARPFVTKDEISRTIKTAEIYGACVLGVPVKDTIKICDSGGFVISTPPRDALWQIQTPQAFSRDIIIDAHESARSGGYTGTDDAELVEKSGRPVRIIMGNYANIKITTMEDLLFFQKSG